MTTIQIIKVVLWALFGSGVIFEISPCKISPFSALLGWFGRAINKDVRADLQIINTQMDNLQKQVDDVQTDLSDHKVESWRRNILEFSDALMRDDRKTKEDFNYIIKSHDKYEKYIEEKGLENGQVDLAFAYISKKYAEAMDNNDFYTGEK